MRHPLNLVAALLAAALLAAACSSDTTTADAVDTSGITIGTSSSTELIWGTDLESDNTVVARFTVGA
ncbi:MAG: hypothetical protein ACRBK7_20595 [Acidimicrobiales bacterium]